MKPILIGMNNPVSIAPGHELYPLPEGCTGHRLWKMLNIAMRDSVSRAQYLSAFERRNLVVSKAYCKITARARAYEIKCELDAGRTVVLLGRAVQQAFGIPPLLLRRQVIGGTAWIQIPHPSGRNLWYNDENNIRSVSRLLARLYRESIHAVAEV